MPTYSYGTLAADPGVLDATLLAETYEALRFYPSDTTRFIAKVVRPVVRFTPGAAGHGEVHVRTIGIRVRPIGRRPT